MIFTKFSYFKIKSLRIKSRYRRNYLSFNYKSFKQQNFFLIKKKLQTWAFITQFNFFIQFFFYKFKYLNFMNFKTIWLKKNFAFYLIKPYLNYQLFLLNFFKNLNLFKNYTTNLYSLINFFLLFHYYYHNNTFILSTFYDFCKKTNFFFNKKTNTARIINVLSYFPILRTKTIKTVSVTPRLKKPITLMFKNTSISNVFKNLCMKYINYWLKYFIFKKTQIIISDVKNTFFNKTKKIGFIKNKNTYFIKFAKLYFRNLSFLIPTSKNYRLESNIFFLTKPDFISDRFAALSNNDALINQFDYFITKSKNFYTWESVSNHKILNFTNKLASNDNFFETCYFFLKTLKKKSNLNYNFSFKKIHNFTKMLKTYNLPSMTYLNSHTQITNKFFLTTEFPRTRIFKNFNFKKNLLPTSRLVKFDILLNFYFKPFFFKYFLLTSYNSSNHIKLLTQQNFFKNFLHYIKTYFFYSTTHNFFFNNIIPNDNFLYILKKKVIKIFSYGKFSKLTSFWHYQIIARFLEFCSGKRVFFKIYAFLSNNLNFYEKTQCILWAQKVKYFRKVLGPRLFLDESLQIIYLALKLKDPYILSNWMIVTMQKISFWKYKTFLRYIKYVLRYFFWSIFRQLSIHGIKYQLKGKISVAGNARTRTAFHYIGFTSHSTFTNRILYTLNLVRTFTGVLGLKLWIVF